MKLAAVTGDGVFRLKSMGKPPLPSREVEAADLWLAPSDVPFRMLTPRKVKI